MQKEQVTPVVVVDAEVKNFDSDVRRPYYRMRGKPVDRAQALEIARRTDTFFGSLLWDFRYHPDYIGSIHFNNWLIERNHYPFGYGWIHMDGTVGCNAITRKYPNATAFVNEWSANIAAFPFLDLVIAVTKWNEMPDDVWEEDHDQCRDFEDKEYDEDFLNAVVVGIYVHDNTVEIMNPARTCQKYLEYDARYGCADRDKYRSEYYDNRGIVQMSEDDFLTCLERY